MKRLDGLIVFFILVLVLIWMGYVIEKDSERRATCREIMTGTSSDLVKVQAMMTVCK